MSEFDNYAPPPNDTKEPVPAVYMADDRIQTLPSSDHPVGDEIVTWFIHGGRAPVDASMLPTGNALFGEEIQISEDSHTTEFPKVIEAIDEARSTIGRDHAPSLGRRATTSIRETLQHIMRPPQVMVPNHEYKPSGD